MLTGRALQVKSAEVSSGAEDPHNRTPHLISGGDFPTSPGSVLGVTYSLFVLLYFVACYGQSQ